MKSIRPLSYSLARSTHLVATMNHNLFAVIPRRRVYRKDFFCVMQRKTVHLDKRHHSGTQNPIALHYLCSELPLSTVLQGPRNHVNYLPHFLSKFLSHCSRKLTIPLPPSLPPSTEATRSAVEMRVGVSFV